MSNTSNPATGGKKRYAMPVLISVTLLATVAIAVVATWAAVAPPSASSGGASANKQLVQEAFDRWRAGSGGPFDLLADDARWTITGSSPASKTYESKEQFLAGVIRPFNARMNRPLKPTVREVHADGDTVVVLFDAEAMCHDGVPYRNTYAWIMQFRDGRAVRVTAFFDTRPFDDMWARVAPR